MTAPLNERLKNLTPAQRALLERRLIERQAGASAQEPIPRRSGDGPWPLSCSQELLWLLDQLAPGEIAYNSPDAVRLEGPLDVEALGRALTTLVERHEILRTTYAVDAGQPVQVVRPPAGVAVDVLDLTALPRADGEPELRRLFKEEAEKPFDLASGPILRATLARLAPDDHAFLLNVHHIATDGWSKAIVWRELSELYNAFAHGSDSPLSDPAIQYADFAVWQRSWLDSGVLDRQLGYWRGKLRGAPDLLELPTDRQRPPMQSYRGDHLHRLYHLSLLEQLRTLSRSEGTTLFVVLLAGFATLLGRYAGQDDVVVGTPTAGRNRVELEDMVGYFMNTLALRIDLSGRPTFRELVARAKETTMEAYANQEVPYEKVVTGINPERDLSRTPLFQAMMVLQNQKRTNLELVDLVVTPFVLDRAWSKFDLTLGLGERQEGLNSNWEYSTELFDASTIERMMGHFETLLGGVLADPDRPVGAVPLLGEEERRQILVGWNATGSGRPQHEPLHTLVAAQARRTPDAVAVEREGWALSYGALEAQAGRMARHLLRLGVGPGQPVGLCLDRSLDLVPSLLGVLAAGGVCLPLDPAYPADRLAFMVSDAGAQVLVTQETFADLLAGAEHVVLVDRDRAAIAAENDTLPDTPVREDDPAYLIYTSGSTGLPCGVVLTHGGLVNHACASVGLYGLTANDRVLQFSPISFDISIEEIFPTLACGAAVVLRTLDTPIAGRDFLGWLRRTGVTVLDLPTAFWHVWVTELAELGETVPECVRLVIVGGEKASATTYRTWLEAGGNRVRFANTYGPTETSVVATAYEPPAGEMPDQLPIGRPIANVRVYVLDRESQPVPIGVWGELCIGGAGVARGYHDRPELTGERFVADPFATAADARMYRTGDLARWLPSGDLQYGGRTDLQVKIRGFRVEPGEVEAALEQHEGVAAAVVLAPANADGEHRLIGYVRAAEATTPPSPPDLRRFLADRLPSFMIPASIMVIEAFPLTPNGKVDRRALAAAEWNAPADDAEAVAPRTGTEHRIAEIWREVLALDGLGVSDNFFALGGHSLLATRVVSRLHQAFGVDVTIRMIFEAPTVAELAQAVEARAGEQRPPAGPDLRRVDRSRYRIAGEARRGRTE